MGKEVAEEKKMYHLFPFQKVKKGTEIILYGYGSMGRQYAEQLSKTGYCRVKYIVDKRWREVRSEYYTIENPVKIKEEINPAIVITTDRYADEIKEWLVNIGVNESSIISDNIELNAYSKEEISLGEDDINYLQEFKRLVSILEVNPYKQFVRIGREYDGGYLMIDDFSASGGIAYSFGINNDVSWDKDMADRGYDVYMYDHTIDYLPEENERFHWEKIGVASNDSANVNLKSLEEIITENEHDKKRNMILKMDVEGAEWGCFDMTSEDTLKKFDQIVLELHEVIQFGRNTLFLSVLDKINKTHQCVHVHLNNYSNHICVNGVPYADSFEVTFVNREKYSFKRSSHKLPHNLDQPCNPFELEIVLGEDYLL